ncbi:MAG: hypothetical protein ABIE23_05820 [archaeon]
MNPRHLEKVLLLQCKLHESLYLFLSADNSNYLTKVFYPFYDVSMNDLVSLKQLLSEIDPIFFEQSISLLEKNSYKKIPSKEYAKIISTIFGQFYSFPELKKIKTKRIKLSLNKTESFNKWAVTAEKDSFLSPFFWLKKFVNENLQEFCSGFFIHGSFADFSFRKGWSDFDSMVLIKKGTVKDEEKLLRLREKMIKLRCFGHVFDPLQHHGPHIIVEEEMDFFPQVFFPFVLFEHSVSFFDKPNSLVFLERAEKTEIKNSLFITKEYFQEIIENRRKIKNAYDWKLFFHNFTLLPVMYLQAKGIHCYKADSFELIGREFSKGALKPLKIVSGMRENWKLFSPLPKKIESFLLNSFNPFLLVLFYYFWFWFEPKAIKKIQKKELLNNCFMLSKKMTEKI